MKYSIGMAFEKKRRKDKGAKYTLHNVVTTEENGRVFILSGNNTKAIKESTLKSEFKPVRR